ncbi:MAG TPA: site-2 protease family protein [Acidobacteriota bacterium]|nr:site-2 protease family protein [Acidobacteriota bacterium]
MKVTFYWTEIIDLLKSFVGITILFSLYYFRNVTFWQALPTVALFVGIGFILHELAHKFMASYYGYNSYYVSNDMMLLASLVIGFFGVLFLAPGAVITENVRKMKHLGIISLAGPATNFMLGIICLIGLAFHPIFVVGYSINAWLALFNMIPFLGLDGEKVLAWNKTAYIISVVVIGALFIGTYII